MRSLALALLLLAAAKLAFAQTGWIEGRVTDGERPVRYPNVLLTGTLVAVMTDEDGRFRFRAPCGRCTLLVMSMGYERVGEPVVIRRNETAYAAITLRRVGVPAETVVTRDDIRSDSTKARRAAVSASQLRHIHEWDYPASTEAVRHDGIEFLMRYTLAQAGDSVVVNVIAEGRNASNDPVTVCGCFSLWHTRYQSGPDDFSQMPLGPARTPEPGTVFTSLDVPPLECDGSRFEESPRVLLPGETIARGMAFSFYPNAFREHPGELLVHGVFFSGHRGDAWEDTDLVDLGAIKAPIRPIGMPIRP